MASSAPNACGLDYKRLEHDRMIWNGMTNSRDQCSRLSGSMMNARKIDASDQKHSDHGRQTLFRQTLFRQMLYSGNPQSGRPSTSLARLGICGNSRNWENWTGSRRRTHRKRDIDRGTEVTKGSGTWGSIPVGSGVPRLPSTQ